MDINYPTIVNLLDTDWNVKISQSCVRSICNFFEAAGKLYLDKEIIENVQSNNRIMLSLDGAQPIKGEPALWVFSDRLTGHVLKAILLDTASAEILQAHMRDIETKYQVPIIAVISDKQRNIALLDIYLKIHSQFMELFPAHFAQYRAMELYRQ